MERLKMLPIGPGRKILEDTPARKMQLPPRSDQPNGRKRSPMTGSPTRTTAVTTRRGLIGR